MKRVLKAIRNPLSIISYLGQKGFLNWIKDERYLHLMYRAQLNKPLNLLAPKTFNEKLQWLKLYDRNPFYTQLVDKYEARKYIAKTIGGEYLIPLFGVWGRFEDINISELPNRFVMKCTHDSGGIIKCLDRSNFDLKNSGSIMKQRLKNNYYYLGREWPYKNVKPRIICEKYMADESGFELKDYKFFCFDGKPRLMYVASNRNVDTRFDFYDMDFNQLPIIQCYANSDKEISKPDGFDEMVYLASQLSKGIPHLRVDFYDINGKVYFGEFTFYHLGGFFEFSPPKWDVILGEMINLPQAINSSDT